MEAAEAGRGRAGAVGGARGGPRDGRESTGVFHDEGCATRGVEVAAEVDGVTDEGIRTVGLLWWGVFEEELEADGVVSFEYYKCVRAGQARRVGWG